MASSQGLLAEEMELVGYMLSPPSSKPDGLLGYPGAAEEVLEASQAQAPHFCHILSQSESQGQPQFKGRKESPPLLRRAAGARGKGPDHNHGPSL